MPKAVATRSAVELDVDGGEPVPAIFQVPAGQTPPFGAALLIHGFSSRKERMADSIGRELSRRGVASLAIDLPLHGAREGGIEGMSLRNPLALVQKWRLAVREAHSALDYLTHHPSVDPDRIGMAGYSLGAYISVIVAAEAPVVKAVALAAGGDLPEATPFAAIVRTIADPMRAARSLGGRPLLMMNGRWDRTIRPEQANTLFSAAREPKEQRWYDGGHWPPSDAIDEVAEWLATRLEARPSARDEQPDAPADSSPSPPPRKAPRVRRRTQSDR